MARVVLVDPVGGLDTIVAGLIEAAVEQPAKARLVDRMTVSATITVPDARVVVGLQFLDGVCTVSPHPVLGCPLRLKMDSDALLELSTVPLLFGLPSVLSPGGRRFVRKLIAGDVRIHGLRHVVQLSRLTRLLSVV